MFHHEVKLELIIYLQILSIKVRNNTSDCSDLKKWKNSSETHQFFIDNIPQS